MSGPTPSRRSLEGAGGEAVAPSAAATRAVGAATEPTNVLIVGVGGQGVIMVSKALLDHNPHPSRQEIVEALSGNVCRCTGYEPIIRAVEDAAGRMSDQESG